MKKTTILIASVLLLLNTACTTNKPIYDTADATYSSQVKAGDRVRLTYFGGQVQEIRVTEVTEVEIKGTYYKNTLHHPKGAELTADWQDVQAVERVKISALKTTGAAVGVVVAIPFIALGLLLTGGSGGSSY